MDSACPIQLLLCRCRNVGRAFYGQANLRSLLGYAVQVQSEVLARQAGARQNGLLTDFCRILAEMEDFSADTCTRYCRPKGYKGMP